MCKKVKCFKNLFNKKFRKNVDTKIASYKKSEER